MRHHLALSLVIVSVAFLTGCGDKQTEIEQSTGAKTNSTPAVKSVLPVKKTVPAKTAKSVHPEIAKQEAVKKQEAESTSKPSLAFQRGHWLHHLQNVKSPAARVHAARRLHPLVDNVEPAVSELIKILGTKGLKKEVIVDALQVIALYGVEAKSAVPVLIQQLSNPDPKIRIHTVLAIHSLGPEAKMAVPKLIERLDDIGTMQVTRQTFFGNSQVPSDPLRVYAMHALTAIGIEARTAIPKLIEAVKKSKNELVAAESLVKISPKEGEKVLLELLSDKEPKNDRAAILGLDGIHTPETFAMLVKLSKSSHPITAGNALFLLQDFGPLAVPHIVQGLKNPYEYRDVYQYSPGHFSAALSNIRFQTTWALADMEQIGHTALLKALNSQDQELRVRVAECLIQIGPFEDRVLPVLIDILKHSKNPTIRDVIKIDMRGERDVTVVQTTTVKSVALEILFEVGAKTKSAIPAIRPLLQQKQLKFLAASVINLLEPDDIEAINILTPEVDPLRQKLVQDKKNLVPSDDYISSFAKLGTPAIPVLIGFLSSKNKNHRSIAIAALGHLSQRSELARKMVIATVEDAIKNRKPKTYELLQAVTLLPSKDSRPLLQRVILTQIQEEDDDYLDSADHVFELGLEGLRIIHSLGKRKTESHVSISYNALARFPDEHFPLLKHKKESIKVLLETLLDPEFEVSLKIDIVEILANLKPDPKIAVPAILKAVEIIQLSSKKSVSDSEYTIELCIDFLSTFGPKAGAAIPLLIKILAQPDSAGDLQSTAIKTLAAIGPAAKTAIPVLIAKFQFDKNVEKPDDALAAIGQPAAPKVRPFLQHGLVEMRLRAVKILGQIGSDASAAAGQIRDRLVNDPRITVRAAAAEALGRIETKTSPDKLSIEKLCAARKDSSLTVRMAAEKALRQLGQTVPTKQ